MDYSLGYLVGSLSLIFIWLVLYASRKDLRKEMLVISLMFGAIGPIFSPLFLTDWWRPSTITRTPVGIEDFLFGFAVGGISTVAYKIFFNRRLIIKKISRENERKRNVLFGFLLALGAIIFLALFFIGIHSFPASVIAMSVSIAVLWLKRSDLILCSLASAVLLVILSVVFYVLPELIFPGWISHTWFFDNLTGLTLLRIPLEDLIWLFFTGLLVGPTYAFWKDGYISQR